MRVWSHRFHQKYDASDDPPDPELLLIHLYRVDHEAALAHHQAMTASTSLLEEGVR